MLTKIGKNNLQLLKTRKINLCEQNIHMHQPILAKESWQAA